MFTGLIQKVGSVRNSKVSKASVRVEIEAGDLIQKIQKGDSISVNGVCLTAVDLFSSSFLAEISPETLARTNLGTLKTAQLVNLELPLQAGRFLGGHFVQGHIDGVGEIESLERVSEFFKVRILYPKTLATFIVEKGSIAVDGVSLTVNALSKPSSFEVMIIPHTWDQSVFKTYEKGTRVNLEVDILAKYVQRAMEVRA